MKTLLLLAFVGCMLSVGFSHPFSEDKGQNDELKDIAADFEDDFVPENPNSDRGIETEGEESEEFDEEDFNDDESDQDEDKTDEDDGTAVEKSFDPFRVGRIIKRASRIRVKRVGRKIVRGAKRVGRTVGRAVLRRQRRRGRRGRG